MLTPSSNFTADQIRFLQTEAIDWIEMANTKIIKAAEQGESQVYIPIWDNEQEKETKYYQASAALDEHFKQRGFKIIKNGQSSIIINWEKSPIESI